MHVTVFLTNKALLFNFLFVCIIIKNRFCFTKVCCILSSSFLISAQNSVNMLPISSAVSEITAKSSANLEWFNFSPLMFISFSLHLNLPNIPSSIAFNNLDEIGSTCRTPLSVSNFSPTHSKTMNERIFYTHCLKLSWVVILVQ